MTQQETLKNLIDNMEDKRLALFIVCCHVDKLMTEEIPGSKYDIFIQAGAALTDKRVCKLNDMDDLPDNISDRNERYSEMSAMYWVGQNIMTDYVGITHYRRRMLINDDELSNLLDQGFDMITTKPCTINDCVKDNFYYVHYKSDWDLFMDILDEFHPEDHPLADELYALDTLHPANINIFSADMYRQYCQWMFPMLDAFHKRSPWKFDTYQRRDVGFIGERLSTLFVEKMKRQGSKIIEKPFKDYRSNEWVPEMECDLTDTNVVMEACRKYFLKHDVSKCRRLVAGALSRGALSDVRIKDLTILFKAGLDEQKAIPLTLYEYLPEQWMADLDTLLAGFQSLMNIIKMLASGFNPEDGSFSEQAAQGFAMYTQFMKATGYSRAFIESCCRSIHIDNPDFVKKLTEVAVR